MKESIPLCDEMYLLGNSSADDPFRPVIAIRAAVFIGSKFPYPPGL
jgi:hypothetical protein